MKSMSINVWDIPDLSKYPPILVNGKYLLDSTGLHGSVVFQRVPRSCLLNRAICPWLNLQRSPLVEVFLAPIVVSAVADYKR